MVTAQDWDDIAIAHNTDKASRITPDHGVGHSYMQTYFECLHDQPIANLLEIGVAAGFSVAAWADIFPDAQIIGLEILPECAAYITHPRITVETGDATQAEFLDEIIKKYPKLDVVIDDGDHDPYHAFLSFQKLFVGPLRPGSWYFVEDLLWPQCTTFLEWCGGMPISEVLLMPDSLARERPAGGQCLLAIRKQG